MCIPIHPIIIIDGKYDDDDDYCIIKVGGTGEGDIRL